MTKKRGLEKVNFFVKKEEFQAKTNLDAESTRVRTEDFLHKTTPTVQLFSVFLSVFLLLGPHSACKEQSVF